EDQQDVGFQLDIGLAGAGRVVDAREQLQAMRVERLAQPRLDLVGIAAGGQLDHVRNLSVSRLEVHPSALRRGLLGRTCLEDAVEPAVDGGSDLLPVEGDHVQMRPALKLDSPYWAPVGISGRGVSLSGLAGEEVLGVASARQ